MKEDVLAFIKHFQNEGTIKTFTNGCCYWFAKILEQRYFWHGGAKIYYNPIDNHFVCEVGGYFYDITGVIPYNDNLVAWDYYQRIEPLDGFRVEMNCIQMNDKYDMDRH